MKYLKTPFVLCLCGVLLFSACKNNDKSSTKDTADNNADTRAIRDIMNTYFTHFTKDEFEAMTAYVYPDIFNDYDKEEMINSMRQSLHSVDFDVTMKEVNIDSISPVYVSEDKSKYALVIHKAKTLYQFKPEQKEEALRNYCIIFSSNFGDENVQCNIAEKNFDIIMEDISFFKYSDSLQKWYTLGTSSEEDLQKYIPSDVRKQMGLRK